MRAALYNTAILRLAASIPHAGRLADAQASVTRVSPVCGSRVTADVDLDDDGRVVRFAHDVRACALGQASAALLGARVIGRAPHEIAAARDALAVYLKGDAAAPEWPGLDVFDLARPHKARHGSILLAFEAAADAARAAAVSPVSLVAAQA